MLVNNVYCPWWGTGYPWPQGENVKTGQERWRWTMQEGGCCVLWSEILLPTPTSITPLSPSSFLRCTVGCTWAAIRSTFAESSEAEQWNNEAMQRGSASQWVMPDMWFVTPSWYLSVLISFSFQHLFRPDIHLSEEFMGNLYIYFFMFAL